MLHGQQRDLFDLYFRVPSGCADEVASGAAGVGIVPAIELARQDLEIVSDVGIACRGAVRSILLISQCPAEQIRTLATDTSSRTSVQLARVVLSRRYGCEPELIPRAPRLEAMLEAADAALIIGDPALHIEPADLPFHVYDLGTEWTALTGAPMVFAVWAGPRGIATAELAEAFRASYAFGMAHVEEIVAAEAPARGLDPELVRRYLTQHIVHPLGAAEYEGMRLFLKFAAERSLTGV
jgi:predicted solute-binding protein